MKRRLLLHGGLWLALACSESEPAQSAGADTQAEPAPPPRSVPPAQRNAYGRWTATPAQEESVKVHIGFGDSLAFSLAQCPATRPVDSLIYGDMEFSQETGDASGFYFVFRRRGPWISGLAIDGAGGISQGFSLRGLTQGDAPGTLTFWYTSGGRMIYYNTVKLGCADLKGFFRARVIPDARYDDSGSVNPLIAHDLRRRSAAITTFPQ